MPDANDGKNRMPYRRRLTTVAILIGAIIACLILLENLAKPYEYPLINQPAPAYALATLDGQPLATDGELGNKVVVLNFWATWCPPCREELPEFAKLATEFPDKPVVFHAVAIDQEPALIASVANELDPKPPVAFDPGGKASSDYQIHYLPTTLVIDTGGAIRAAYTGFTDVTIDVIRREIEGLLQDSTTEN